MSMLWMEKLSSSQRQRIDRLWAEKPKSNLDMPNAGHSFVKVMEYVIAYEK
ncbi:MAG: hypothetical protein M2R45_05135 [Verrucomicrobia subdivision 3 bacterium]|nr:hypothetical protein [Limisphaerales bacterium]MCS1417197.1 hypothetical protein [Limisphaerales bacterium]